MDGNESFSLSINRRCCSLSKIWTRTIFFKAFTQPEPETLVYQASFLEQDRHKTRPEKMSLLCIKEKPKPKAKKEPVVPVPKI